MTLLLKIAAGNPRLPADLRPWANQLRAIAVQPGGSEVFIALGCEFGRGD
ncbi:MAG: hypothetical protein J2P28_09555 [Actinobacteria bacterium]|nr:hypothetical protein [Actinomycetota bacterium]